MKKMTETLILMGLMDFLSVQKVFYNDLLMKTEFHWENQLQKPYYLLGLRRGDFWRF